jgi:hypothetical protein
MRGLLIFLTVGFSPMLLAQFEDSTIGELTGEVLLLSENTSGLPGGRDDLERTRLFVWLDLEAPINDNFSFGVSVYGNLGTDDEDDNRRNLDNSPSNSSEIDQAYLDWNFSESGFLRVGRQRIPAKLSSMLWDRDISTVGVSVSYDWLSEQDNEYQFTAGSYTVDHLFSEETHLSFADFHFSVPVGGVFISSGVTLMQVTDSEFLLQDNVQRTNTPGALLEGFEIAAADLSFNFSLFEQPVTAGVEASQNLAMDEANQAYRVNLIIGDNAVEDGWQFNLHYQDVERDASVAAYVDDDWWFATWMTGYRVSTSYGLTEDTFVQVSYFDEELQVYNTKRVFLELRSFF